MAQSPWGRGELRPLTEAALSDWSECTPPGAGAPLEQPVLLEPPTLAHGAAAGEGGSLGRMICLSVSPR